MNNGIVPSQRQQQQRQRKGRAEGAAA